jgi:hypothetical protein
MKKYITVLITCICLFIAFIFIGIPYTYIPNGTYIYYHKRIGDQLISGKDDLSLMKINIEIKDDVIKTKYKYKLTEGTCNYVGKVLMEGKLRQQWPGNLDVKFYSNDVRVIADGCANIDVHLDYIGEGILSLFSSSNPYEILYLEQQDNQYCFWNKKSEKTICLNKDKS